MPTSFSASATQLDVSGTPVPPTANRRVAGIRHPRRSESLGSRGEIRLLCRFRGLGWGLVAAVHGRSSAVALGAGGPSFG
jgi:hypothetical protein